MKTVAITGNTYPVKDQLRALGGRWDGAAKSWQVPEDKADEARALVAGQPPATGSKAAYRPPSRCRSCGSAPTRYIKIYRNGLCGPCFGDARDGYFDD